MVGGLGSDVGSFVPYPEEPQNQNNNGDGGNGQQQQQQPPPPPTPGRVLIHDMMGTTRAPLVAAAWLVAAHGASPQAALMACAARRPGVAPKAADVQILAAFARELRSSPGEGAEFAAAGQRQRELQQAQMQGGMMMAGQQQQQQQSNFFQQ